MPPLPSPAMSHTQILPSTRREGRQKKVHSAHSSSSKLRSSSLDLPDRLKHGDDSDKDVSKVTDPNLMNRSVFNMIQAANANVDYQNPLAHISSESESEPEAEEDKASLPTPKPSKSARKSLMQSIHRFKLKSIRERDSSLAEDKMSSSQILEPPRRLEAASSPVDNEDLINRDAPFLSRMLKGEAEMRQENAASRTSSDSTRGLSGKSKGKETLSLAQKIKDIFQLEEPEEVIGEYPAWFLQTVLLSGYLYVTQKHICFYAYLPKNTTTTTKSGYLSKRGQHNPRFNRYYVELKGNVLRYFEDPSNIYMPSGQIDLRFGISATISADKTKQKEESSLIKLETRKRTFFFKADSPQSARDWVKHLQRIIFRTHNDGDSVKILIPINNIIDFEETNFLEVSDTVKLKVIDNDETYSVDEYFFSFFGSGNEALNVLKVLISDNGFHQEKGAEAHPEASRPSIVIDDIASVRQGSRSTPVQEPVRATLLPFTGDVASRRSSFESRSSTEVGDRSRGRSRDTKDRQGRSRQESNDSEWNDHTTNESSLAAIESIDDSNVSASQILDRTDVFRPTSHVLQLSRESSEDSRSKGRSSQGRPGLTSDQSRPLLPHSSSSTFEHIVRAGSYPLNRASDIARRMSSQITSQSIGVLEKLHGMWEGPTRHYGPVDGMPPDDDNPNGLREIDNEFHSRRFQEHFALPESEKLIATYFAYFWRLLPLYGKIYISQNFFCFRSLLAGTRTKIMIPMKDIESVMKKKNSYRIGHPGLVITIRGHEELFFDFPLKHMDARDDCTIVLILVKEALSKTQPPVVSNTEAETAIAEYNSLKEARGGDQVRLDLGFSRSAIEHGLDTTPVLFDDPKASILNFKPQPMKVTCLTIGSRGDVQPYIALAKGLMADGHTVKIATHSEFEPWIRKHGIDFAPVSGDPGELMRICIQNGMFTASFLKEAHGKFRGWIVELLESAWEACQGIDLLIESPSAMAGIHIAEALQIPYFRAFTMPWTRTRAYPHAFAVPSTKRGGAYNYLSYVVIDAMFWHGIAGNVNHWRAKRLSLPPTTLDKMQPNKVPFLYTYSPYVVPPPLDYPDWIRITGYWFLDEGDVYEPPKELVAFIKKARDDGKKLVYIGFGSILVDDVAEMTQTVIDSVLKADVRAILVKGWMDRVAGVGSTTTPKEPTEIPLPPEIYPIKSVPHDWLFPQMDAVAHHGGSGTTGASLRAGVPTIAKPFFGDQHFFGARLEDLGVGICLKKLNSTVFGRALWEATRSERMKTKAAVLGEEIRGENGVVTAINALYRDLDYARSLIKRRSQAEELEEIGEHWTFVDTSEVGSDAMMRSVADLARS